MNKHNYFNKTIICVLAVSLSVMLFAGCQSKTQSTAPTSDQSNTTATSNQTNTGTAQNSDNQTNQDNLKNQIQNDVKSLVTAGTITQAQADKIVTALTTRNASTSNKKPPQGNQPQHGEQQNGSKGNDQGKGFSPLSQLVSDGTITQAQADAVMKKISADMPRNKGNNPHNSSNQS